MNRSRFFALRDQLALLRKDCVLRDGQRVPASILALEDELVRERNSENRYDLYLLMRSEYFEAGLPHLEIETMRKCVDELSDEPLAWIGLAEALRTGPGFLSEAKDVAKTAVSKAVAANRLIRYALTTQARIAADARDADLLNHTISHLIGDAENEREADAPFSIDFLQGVPAQLLNRELTEKYVAIARRTNTQNTGHEDRG